MSFFRYEHFIMSAAVIDAGKYLFSKIF